MDESGKVDILVRSIAAFWERIASFLTLFLMAAAILVVGVLIAVVARIFVSRFLKLVKFDRFVERSGLESFFSASPYPVTLSGIIGWIVFILIILTTMIAAADLLHLTIISHIFERIVLYLPRVILAVLILVFGVVFSRFLNNFVFGALTKARVGNALTISTTCEYMAQVFVWFFALEQLLETHLLLVAFAILFGAFCLAGAIAFGLAGRRHASRLLSKGLEKIEGRE